MVRPTRSSRPGDEDADWPPFLPHREIDLLIERLESGASDDPGDGYRLLTLVAKEAQRLRTMVLRLSTAKLSEAEREARSIIAEALGQADAMRAAALSVLDARLDEADQVLAVMRDSFRTELRSAELGQLAADRGEAR